LKTSPSWGEVPFLCPKILTAQGLRLLQNAQVNKNGFMLFKLYPINIISIYVAGGLIMKPEMTLSGKTPLANGTSSYCPGRKDLSPTPLITSEDQIVRLERQGEYISIGEEQLIKAIDRAIKALEGPHTVFEVSVHQQTKSIMVKVLDRDSGELIREIPPEKTLDLVAKMMEIAGILIDERV
jgi:flagellar protein FlaG